MSLLDKIKDTANKAAEGVQKAAESGQEKLEETKLKKKIGDLKEELGGVVYAQRVGTADASAESEITRLVGEIRAADEQMAALKSDGGDAAEPATD
ncbi:MAG: hypothetical protein ACXVJ7_03790 [Acidimicrobiia bacterium]